MKPGRSLIHDLDAPTKAAKLTKKPVSRRLAFDILGTSSRLIALLSFGALTYPYLPIWHYAAFLVPLLYLLSFPGWISVITAPRRHIHAVREVEVRRHDENGEYPVKRLKQEVDVELDPAGLPRPTLMRRLTGYHTSSRLSSILTLLTNSALLVMVLDQVTPYHPFLQEETTSYARVASLTPTTATINLRFPSLPGQDSARIAYRPLLPAEELSESSPVSWEMSEPIPLHRDQDWTSKVRLDGLHPDITYECEAEMPDEDLSSLNFTTFPSSRLSPNDKYRFIHTGSPRYYSQPYEPFAIVPSLLPLSYPFTTPSPSHIQHRWRAHRLRQPAWHTLGLWLEDMRDRTAWAQVKFALVGGEMEEMGHKHRPMGVSSRSGQRDSRLLMAAHDVQDIYESLPVLSAAPHSPSEGSVLEPAALASPELTFNYADTLFYRLRAPFQEMGQAGSRDWLADISDLKDWLSRNNGTSGFKFITSPMSLAPWWSGKDYEQAWKEAVIDAIAYTPNVIVLAESHRGFIASILRKTIVELASPPMDSIPTSRWWSGTKRYIPDFTRVRYQSHYRWEKRDGEVVEVKEVEQLDRLLNYIPISKGAKWTSIEVECDGDVPVAKASVIESGKSIWTLEVVGTRGKDLQKTAVGAAGEGFVALLKRLGLLGRTWF